jgi:hypothetical protein
MGIRHWAEYDHVLERSSAPETLIKLHETPCTEQEAIAILHWLDTQRARRLFRDAPLPMRLYFMGYRGRAGMKIRQGKAHHHMSLPSGAVNGGRRLRVGLVLHEYAHLVAPSGEKHGKIFVDILDDLVRLFNTGTMPREQAAAGPPIHRRHQKRGKCWRCGQQTTRRHSTLDGRYSCKACEHTRHTY